jgi:hypothetical protein
MVFEALSKELVQARGVVKVRFEIEEFIACWSEQLY